MSLLRNTLMAAVLTSAAAMSLPATSLPASAMSIQNPQAPGDAAAQPNANPATPGDPAAQKPAAQNPVAPDADKAASKKKKKAPEKKSDNGFLDGYRSAYALIYEQQDYAAGIVALKALGHDGHPDVANLIGFSSRKLGRTEDAKFWYEKALAADPKHARTWQYYGMWQLEQGERAKAEEYLERIRQICGPCEEYASLRGALDGQITY